MEEQDSIAGLKKNYLPNVVYPEFPEELSALRRDVINAISHDILKNKNKTNFEYTLTEFQELTGVFLSNREQYEELKKVLDEVSFVCNEGDGFSVGVFILSYGFEYNKSIRFEISDMARRYFEQLSHWS